MNKKELGDKLNEMLGVDWDWTKPLTKDQLEVLYDLVKGLYDLLNENEDVSIESIKRVMKLAVKKKVKSRAENLLDRVLSGKGPILSIIRGDDE